VGKLGEAQTASPAGARDLHTPSDLFIGCILVLGVHQVKVPVYKETSQDRVESVFLALLIVIAALQLPSTAFAYLGQVDNSSTLNGICSFHSPSL